uniref:Uncharacterized protein n=1 Tax=Rhizophora mucronata TaxID=61149 RepID=A0A2P2LHL2_RHIMU
MQHLDKARHCQCPLPWATIYQSNFRAAEHLLHICFNIESATFNLGENVSFINCTMSLLRTSKPRCPCLNPSL